MKRSGTRNIFFLLGLSFDLKCLACRDRPFAVFNVVCCRVLIQSYQMEQLSYDLEEVFAICFTIFHNPYQASSLLDNSIFRARSNDTR